MIWRLGLFSSTYVFEQLRHISFTSAFCCCCCYCCCFVACNKSQVLHTIYLNYFYEDLEYQQYLCNLQVFCQLEAVGLLVFDKTLRSAERGLVVQNRLTEYISAQFEKASTTVSFLKCKIYLFDIPHIWLKNLIFSLVRNTLPLLFSFLMTSANHCLIDLTISTIFYRMTLFCISYWKIDLFRSLSILWKQEK